MSGYKRTDLWTFLCHFQIAPSSTNHSNNKVGNSCLPAQRGDTRRLTIAGLLPPPTHTRRDSPMLEKRGIPGVASDAFHFAYFEDSTAHRASPPIHSEFDTLLEPLYIFIGLLAGYVILSLVVFMVREYLWSLKNKKRLGSSGSSWSNHSIPLTAGAERHANQFQQKNRAYPDIHSHDSPYAHGSMSPPLDGDEEAIGDSPLVTPLNVLENLSTGSSLVQNSGNSKGIHSSISKREPSSGVIGFSMRKLIELKPLELNGVPSEKLAYDSEGPHSFERASKPHTPLQTIEFKSGKVAQKTIVEIETTLRSIGSSNPVLRSLVVLRLISIAANSRYMNNPNIFLPEFNRVMDFLVDTGTIFDILQLSNAYMARHLIDLVIQYCYCHWTFGKVRNPQILEKFRAWKFLDPLAQPHYVLFRYMVNLQLGLFTVEDHLDEDLMNEIKTRTTVVLTHIATFSTHGDPEKIIPVLAQCAEITDSIELKTLYYDLLYKLTEAHIDCCMGKLLRRKDGDLKALIQGGLWVKNSRELVKKAKKVYKLLVKRAPAIHVWYDEVGGGAVYVSQTPKPVEQPNTTRTDSTMGQDQSGKPLRPGSWKSTSPKK